MVNISKFNEFVYFLADIKDLPFPVEQLGFFTAFRTQVEPSLNELITPCIEIPRLKPTFIDISNEYLSSYIVPMRQTKEMEIDSDRLWRILVNWSKGSEYTEETIASARTYHHDERSALSGYIHILYQALQCGNKDLQLCYNTNLCMNKIVLN